MGKLSAAAVKHAQPRTSDYKLADGHGLYLLVKSTGSKLWRYDFRLHGKRRTMALGKYDEVSLAEARSAHEGARALVQKGEDPIHAVPADDGAPITFETVARDWLKSRAPGWSTYNLGRVTRRLEADVFPRMGAKPVAEITKDDVLAVLRAIESRGVGETVYRVKGYISEVFGFAIGQGHVEADPTAPITAGKLLKDKPRKVHRAALKEHELGPFLVRLRDYSGPELTRLAIRLTMLTVARTDEIRFAEFSEMEKLDQPAEALWRIPADRMKPHGSSGLRTEHLVPLSDQARATVLRIKEIQDDRRRLFAAPTRSGVISENCMLTASKYLTPSKMTVHGFRGSFSTICNEREFNSEAIELCLAHVETNEVRRAYNSARLLGPRRQLLQWWADFLDEREQAARHRATFLLEALIG